jgi:hypothetical protein
MKNHLYKAALLAALGLGSITAAHAQQSGDLVIGFSSTAAGVTQDYQVDLGSFSGMGVNDNLSSALNVSTLQSIFGSSLSGVSVGIVGWANDPNGVNTDLFRSTTRAAGPFTPPYTQADSTTPARPTGNGNISGAAADIASLNTSQGNTAGINKGTSASPGAGSWSDLIAQSSTAIGFLGANSYAGQVGNPMGVLVSDGHGGVTLNLDLYEDNNTSTTGRNFIYQGYFNLDVNGSSDTLTFDPVAAVPEPGTYGMLAGAGLLLVAVRRQFTAKNA